jgi:heavy metal translocating P-type ATPase
MLGQMIAIVRNSLEGRSPLENRMQRWLTLFVPGIFGLSLATMAIGSGLGLPFGQALLRSITVMVIACPCALGIAIPLTRVAGISGAARQGVLVRDFQAFEQAVDLDTIVLDKTGTVTHGQWRLRRVESVDRDSECDPLALAAGLEHAVDHPVAQAIGDHARRMGISPLPVAQVIVSSEGIRGCYNQQRVAIGSRHFVTDGKISFDPIGIEPEETSSRVYLAISDRIRAVFHFADELRPNMRLLVQTLKGCGFDLHLISGDSQTTTQTVAGSIGIENASGGLLPTTKVDYLKALQARGRKVAMVGDGINDAPAMACADLAVAVNSGAPLTGQLAAVTLMQRGPLQLCDFINWARKVNKKVRQNLGWAWAYNLIALPVAMAGFLTPLVAVCAMLLSSLTVIGNTLRLVRGQERVRINPFRDI